MHRLGRSQTLGAVQRSSVYKVNELSLLRSSAWLFILTYYLGRTVDQVRADLMEVHHGSTVDHDRLRTIAMYSNPSHCLATLESIRNESTKKCSHHQSFIVSVISVHA